MGSCIGMADWLAIVAGAAADFQHTSSISASDANIAFIFLFGVVFAFAFTLMQLIYLAEVLFSKLFRTSSVMQRPIRQHMINELKEWWFTR